MSSTNPRVIPIVAAEAASEVEGEGGWLFEKQKKIYPRSVTGTFANWRWAMVWLTQIVFYGLPWLQWNDRQAVLFDLAARRFYIFGLVLHPQDLVYLAALLIVCAYSLFLFTAVAGRLWCGFTCPQTVYTEIFLWVERRFEGDRIARMRLDEAPWSFNKLWRKAGKQAVWIAIGLWTGFTLVGYFTPVKVLWSEAFTLGFGPWEWFWVLFYGFATYGNAGYLREQVCTYMCPYARFQSAMFDRDTLIVSYDPARGEPRGSRGRKVDPKSKGLGDCIDCGLCVQVCPTGIDIRNGLQYQCIGCASCVDVCNEVMDKMNYERGLIRFATQNGLSNRWSKLQTLKRVLRPRVLVYTTVLALICIGFVVSLALRSPFRVDVVRDRGALARLVDDGAIENVYRLQVMNATEATQHYRVTLEGLDGASITSKAEFEVGAAEARWWPVSVQVPHAATRALGPGAHPLRFRVERLARGDDGSVDVVEKSTFVVPR
ncbi:cytochrome c oxidase accessory protein CcoG [Piscinibacter gummiphilus]|uniref:Cytochrome c oxidase accessory protein CcoG n=1 Tax=Piscinibacter gummiphilus TaxID=946333 RepID=A0ABZ0CM58_9BURK|nr:cytochrome c oxidase accessory protein CcoG [Piscinibacter gummiphilus]WOB06050.1 cytochrome c oxidase accessory protein CcoG [Piscinibacter gummiphilus]